MKIRNNVMIAITIVFTSCIVISQHSFALYPGSTGAQFLKLGAGARAVAMGEAFVAVSDDINGITYNPAGLSSITNHQLSFLHTEWLQSIRYENIAYCQPALGGILGGSATVLWIDDIERRTGDTPDPDGYAPARDVSISIAYSKVISKSFSTGINAKIIYQQLDDEYAYGGAVDLGMKYIISQNLSLGFALQNLGLETAFISEQYPLPLNLKAGVADKILPNLILASDINYSLLDSVFQAGIGSEWALHPMFSIRGGYKYNSATFSLGALSGLSVGAGFNINFLTIDYAFIPYGELGMTNRISLIARF